MARFKCAVDRHEINPFAAILNFAAACFIVAALFNEWLILEPPSDNTAEMNPRTLLNTLNDESTVCNCNSIGSQLFLLPAKFTIVKRNGTNHIFYHYDNQIYVDCVSPIVADYFYLITAFCFVAMSVSTFATLIHSMTPPFSFFSYLRMVTALEIVVCILISLILLLTVIVKAEVEEVQRYTEQNKIISSGLSVFLIISSGVLTLNAAVLAQLRQRQIRLTRRVENKRLMCNRPLRSRRDAPPNDFNAQPIAELEHYLLEPGLRRNPSTNTISTTCVEELSTNVDQEDGEETRN